MSILAPALKHLAPRQRVRSLAWMTENIQTYEGRPYDHGAYPHLGAPGGPCDAFDDDTVRAIWLQFGSRLGKTFLATSFLLMMADLAPCPMMFASSTEQTAKDVVKRMYLMADKCRPIAWQLRPEKLRNSKQMDFAHCLIYIGYSRGPSTLADKGVKVLHCNEIDKWEHKGLKSGTATEADPFDLARERVKEYAATCKEIIEGTPAVKGTSRIEHGRLQSTNCSYHVPCPHCGHYQVLKFDRIQWQKLESGKSDRELARTTAHYVCVACEGKILDHHRGPMMRAGVWAPEGCQVDNARAKAAAERWYASDAKGGDGAALEPVWQGWSQADWIIGPPLRNGVEAGYHLSSLYALSLGWGDLAAKWLDSQGSPQKLRNWINSWLAETWQVIGREEGWEALGKRLISKIPRYVVPAGHAFITAAIDKQEWGFPYEITSWGPGRRCHTLDYGSVETLEELEKLLTTRYRREGEDGPEHWLSVSIAFIDSGYRPKGVAEFVRDCRRKGINIFLCKGASTPMPVIYKKSPQGKNSATPGMILVLVDTILTQDWIEGHLSSTEGLKTVFEGQLYEHQNYLEQLLNDAPVNKLDSSNNARLSWDRIDEDLPNDHRDTSRYNIAAMMMKSRGGPIVAEEGRKTLAQMKEEAAKRRAA